MTTTIIERRSTKTELSEFDLHPLLARIYSARGVKGMVELERGLDKLLPYDQLKNIDKAVDVLVQALEQQQSIMIVGDFDADGATSTTLMVSALTAIGAKEVNYIVPNRFEYGYGLSPEIVVEAAKQSPDLIITVDNGISSVEGVEMAKKLGITVLITDHHLAPAVLPDAAAIVNPNQPDDLFPSKNLAGVGVAFYVMLALRSRLRQLGWFAANSINEPNMGNFLDLVALGTVADVVPLDHNNRILVQQGIDRMRKGKIRPGIKALLEIANRDPKNLVSSNLGFIVGPRLNAAGRLDDMSIGIRCLLTEDAANAREIAAQLDGLNVERREIEDKMKTEAMSILANIDLNKKMPTGICLFDSHWHQGVVGILAARIKEKFHRPVIAFAKVSDTEMKGSARSVVGVHIRDVLDAVATKHPELVSKFGGHAMAAGLSLSPDNFSAFSDAFDAEVKKHLSDKDICGKIFSDGELVPDDFCLQVAELLEEGGPWGQEFPAPSFDGTFKIVQQRLLKEKHLKLILASGDKYLDAIAFNVDTRIWPNMRCENVQVAYKLDINEWQGRRNVQLIVDHIVAA